MNHRGITRGQMVRGGLAAGAALGLSRVFPAASAADAPVSLPAGLPNIILVMSDDQGCGQVGYAGNKRVQTPTLDAMARNGLVFTRFYSAGGICSPSRVACLTGRFPSRYPAGNTLKAAVNERDITIPVALKTKGYTAGHFGKRHGDPTAAGGYDEIFLTRNDRSGDRANNKASAMVIWSKVKPFIERAAASKTPFFCTVWFHEPHVPFRAVDRYRDLYKNGEPEIYAEISQMDDHIGMLRRQLRDAGVADNTLVWFCSDNGAKSTEDSGLRGAKSDVYEGGLRVPGVLEWPAVVKPGRRTDVRACGADLYPTILRLLDLRMPHQPPIDGVSLAGLIRGERMDRRPTPMYFWCLPDEREPRPTWAVIDGRHKLLSTLDTRGDLDMLFDIDADPNETQNVLARQPHVARKLKGQLRAWEKTALASRAGQDYR